MATCMGMGALARRKGDGGLTENMIMSSFCDPTLVHKMEDAQASTQPCRS